MKFCSPSKKNVDFTCFEYSDLIEIAKAINKTLRVCKKDKCIVINSQINIGKGSSKNKEKLYNDIYKILQKVEKEEYDWIELDFIKNIKDKQILENIQKFTFKPPAPKTKNSWFNTDNINLVLEQYNKLYPDFTFLGAQPADISLITKIDYKKIQTDFTYIGIVFNKDKHTLPGSHWVAVFIDNSKKKIEYFDSLGKSPNKYINHFLQHFKDYNVVINKVIHQKKGTNCGVYACYFIIQRLLGKTFDTINERIIKDKMMSDYRLFLFRPN